MGGSPPGSAGVPPAQILPQLRPSPPPESTGSGALPLLRPGPCGSRRQGGRLQHRRETERQPKGQHAGGTPALPGVSSRWRGGGYPAGDFSESRPVPFGKLPFACEPGARPPRLGRSIEKDYKLNIDAQDAQDNQDRRLLQETLTRAMIVCGFEDVREHKPAVSGKNPVHPVHPCESKIYPCLTMNRFPATRRRRLFQASRAPALQGGSYESETGVFQARCQFLSNPCCSNLVNRFCVTRTQVCFRQVGPPPWRADHSRKKLSHGCARIGVRGWLRQSSPVQALVPRAPRQVWVRAGHHSLVRLPWKLSSR